MPAWRDRAACLGLGLSRFFEDAYQETGTCAASNPRDPGLAEAVSVCSGCPVRVPCFEAAMAEESEPGWFVDEPRVSVRHGIRGGMTPQQRYSAYLRDSWRCHECREVIDPLGLAAGDVVCGCGSFQEPPIHVKGDAWGIREDNLQRKITTWVLGCTEPGDLLPTLTELKALIGDHRKDAAARWVLEKLTDDGLLEAGPGSYRRLEGKRAWATWVAPARRYASAPGPRRYRKPKAS